MHKLVILIGPMSAVPDFDELWPEFLHKAEAMPGLRREVTSRVEEFLFGDQLYELVHELYFDSLREAQEAMASVEGRAAGKLLQHMTRGQITLFFADHNQDDLENIRKYQTGRTEDA